MPQFWRRIWTHRQIGHGLAVGRAVALEPGDRAAAEPLAELEQQAGLADAGLADHADRLPPSLLHAREQFLQVLAARASRPDEAGEPLPAGSGRAGAARAPPEHANAVTGSARPRTGSGPQRARVARSPERAGRSPR